MQNMHRVLVGLDVTTDGTLPEPTQEALDQALWLGKVARSEVTLLSILKEDPVDTDALVEGSADPDSAAIAVHKRIIEQAAEDGVHVHSLVRHGRPSKEMTRAVLQGKFDLVIVGTREHGAAHKMLFGSTAQKLLRQCPCPVWVTRPGIVDRNVTTIVAADDFSPVGERVLHHAVSTGQLMNARLLVVHAVTMAVEGSLKRTEISEQKLEKYREEARQEAEQRVLERLAMTDYRTLQEGTQVSIGTGRPEVEIEKAVKENNADLLVMGTIARGGLPGLLIGNTAERLFAELQCSLLAIKPDDFKCPVTLEG